MKRFAIACACAATLALALTGCGGAAESGGAPAGSGSVEASAPAATAPAPAANLTDFGWTSFEMPEGFEDTHEQDTYITIANAADDDQTIKIDNDTTTFQANADEAADKRVGMSPDSYVKGEPFTMGGYEWIPVAFTFNDLPSSYYYANISDKYTVNVVAYCMTEADAPVQTVLSTIQFDESKIE